MRISRKLHVLTAILLGIATLVGSAGLYGLNVTTSGMETIYKDRVVPLKGLKEVADAYAVEIVDVTHKIRGGSMRFDEGLARFEGAQALIAQRWREYLSTNLVPSEQQLVDTARPRMAHADRELLDLQRILKAQDEAALAEFVTRRLYPAIDPVSESISHLVQVQLEVAKLEFDKGEAAYSRVRALVIALLIGGVITGFGLAFWLIRSGLERPLALTQGIARAIAQGKLSVTVPNDRNDEMGTLLAALEDMRSNLQSIVQGLKSTADGVTSASGRLMGNTTQVASATEQQSEAAAAMAASVEQMTVSISHVASSAQEAHAVSRDAEASARSGREVIEKTESELRSISESVSNAAGIVHEMGHSSERITGILQVIREVADQTNLLALNAAIEAARAGEQGRGFAVVADEVRKLAERTAHATVEISEVISTVQQNARSAVSAMDVTVERLDLGVALARKANESIEEIGRHARQVASAINDISCALGEQSAASNDIASNVQRVAVMSEENAAATREAAETARCLGGLADKSLQAVAVFS